MASRKIKEAKEADHSQATRHVSEPTSEAPLPDSIPAVILSFAEFAELLAVVNERWAHGSSLRNIWHLRSRISRVDTYFGLSLRFRRERQRNFEGADTISGYVSDGEAE